jgi:undecaprenyl-phosphate 4-deoxy-4-formamido-L-arabinose transferase
MCVILVLGGLILLMLGILGEYIGRMYINMNNSPQYVIREKFSQKGDKP